jgi:hypothetical protein
MGQRQYTGLAGDNICLQEFDSSKIFQSTSMHIKHTIMQVHTEGNARYSLVSLASDHYVRASFEYIVILPPSQMINDPKNLRESNHLKFDQIYAIR